jgi:hypothetical protein
MLILSSTTAFAQTYSPPAGIRPAFKGRGGSILPGGRVIAPAGEQYGTGSSPCGFAISASGRVAVTVNRGGEPSLTVLERGKRWEVRHLPLSGPLSCEVAFAGEHVVWISEGPTGRMARFDLASGERRRTAELTRAPEMERPSGRMTVAGRSFVADTVNDSIVVMDGATERKLAEIPIRIPQLANLRGVIPCDLAFDEKTGWLLVAEAGINAIGVIDTHSEKVLGHIPAGWYPSRVFMDRGTAFVMNARSDSVSIYPLPRADELPAYTELVMRAGGFESRPEQPRTWPSAITHVVLIRISGYSFDEVLGDITHAANGRVLADPGVAWIGRDGYASGRGQRLSLQHVNITPNLHAIAQRWSFSDNFYDRFVEDAVAFGELRVQGDPRGPGGPPHNARVFAAPKEVSTYDFRVDEDVSDTERAARFIHELGGMDLPPFVSVHLLNGARKQAQPERGYPYAESFAADNDLAVGRILQYLSGTKWWGQMAVFITAEPVANATDHIDPRRTILICAGPWAKRGYVSHRNTDSAGVVRTIAEAFRLPPVNLFDATAASLSDCIRTAPDLSGYQALPEDPRLYDPR